MPADALVGVRVGVGVPVGVEVGEPVLVGVGGNVKSVRQSTTSLKMGVTHLPGVHKVQRTSEKCVAPGRSVESYSPLFTRESHQAL